jgi:hypothetical protein
MASTSNDDPVNTCMDYGLVEEEEEDEYSTTSNTSVNSANPNPIAAPILPIPAPFLLNRRETVYELHLRLKPLVLFMLGAKAK